MARRIYVHERCIHCKEQTLTTRGTYQTKEGKRQRYYCYDCKKSFIGRRVNFRSRLNIEIIREIKRLANKKKLSPNKYSLHRKTNPERALLYTDSDVVKIIRKKFRKKISRNSASKLIKKFRKND